MKQKEAKPKKNKNIAWCLVDGEVVVIPLEQRRQWEEIIVVFNETATLIWSLINGKNSAQDIAESITREYAINDKKAQDNVDRFLSMLESRKLINF